MYKTTIEGETREHETIEDVIDCVEDNTCFEVDSYALKYDLTQIKAGEKIVLRDDCVIESDE